MKRTVIITGIVIVVAVVGLVIFSKVTSANRNINIFAEVNEGLFEITVNNAGELMAENSVDIKGPDLNMSNNRRGGRGGHMHAMDFKIQDIVPEGTIVQKGDYVAQLDRTEYDNTLKDEQDNLTQMQQDLNMTVLDTSVTLTGLRDNIKNQRFAVEEAEIELEQSKYEPPAVIRKAEMNLNKEQRALKQKIKDYELRSKQTIASINHQKQHLDRQTRLVNELQDFLAEFTIYAPSPGMVIYKKERNGTKRKTGSQINPFDRVVATLPDLASMISKVYINEIDISKIKPGLAVNVTVDAFPDKSYTGSIVSIANVGEQLPNSDAKMFEVHIRLNGSDPALRPAMTTWNRIIVKSYDDALFLPSECVHAGQDSITFVYRKNKTKQIVVLGESNDKNVIVKRGLKPGNMVYLITPPDPGDFKLSGQNLISVIKTGMQGSRE
jgi:hypothetical protein